MGQGLLDERGIVCLVEALLSNATLRKLDLQVSVSRCVRVCVCVCMRMRAHMYACAHAFLS